MIEFHSASKKLFSQKNKLINIQYHLKSKKRIYKIRKIKKKNRLKQIKFTPDGKRMLLMTV